MCLLYQSKFSYNIITVLLVQCLTLFFKFSHTLSVLSEYLATGTLCYQDTLPPGHFTTRTLCQDIHLPGHYDTFVLQYNVQSFHTSIFSLISVFAFRFSSCLICLTWSLVCHDTIGHSVLLAVPSPALSIPELFVNYRSDLAF